MATAATTDMTVANTILQQLGGRMFTMMTGSKNFIGGSNSLTFKVGSNGSKVTHVRITLTPADVYTVEFMNVRGMKVTTLSTHEDVYCDQLQELFTRETGMYTSLGARRG